jgi:DNA polymerase I
VRGYEIRRTDAFELQSASQMKVFELLLNGDSNGAIELAKDLVSRLKSGVIPKEFVPEDTQDVELLVISRSVKEENEYDRPESMSNVQAAQKLRKMGQEVVSGMKVSWIVTDGKSSPQQVEPYVSGIQFNVKPDWEYYARRLAQTLSYVTEVYGWDEKALLTGKQAAKQTSLLHEEFNGESKKEKPEVKRTDKSLKVEDFF